MILVKSAKAAERVMGSVMNNVEKELGLIVNRTKSRSGKLAETTFLGFQISARGKVKWSAKALLSSTVLQINLAFFCIHRSDVMA